MKLGGTAQLETIAELQTARTPQAMIAQRIGIDIASFNAWLARLAAASDYVEPVVSTRGHSAEVTSGPPPTRA